VYYYYYYCNISTALGHENGTVMFEISVKIVLCITRLYIFTISRTLLLTLVCFGVLLGSLLCLQGGYDSDFLDDTALIKAFDSAINPIKVFVLILVCSLHILSCGVLRVSCCSRLYNLYLCAFVTVPFG